MGVKVDSVWLDLPFIGRVKISRTEAQRRAAWALYVQLATRIASQPLEPGQGSAREALESLHDLFDETRQVLEDAGPDLARGKVSIGPLAIRVLNDGVRPFLVHWHTRLSAFEHSQGEGAVEAAWPERDAFYGELEAFRLNMRKYVVALGELAGVEMTDIA